MSRPAATATTEHFVFLDGLRGIAAIAVMLGHEQGNYPWVWWPAPYELAVDFFFMLSGFVIAHAYEKRFRSGLSALAFARIRIIRLQPLLILGMLLGIAAWLPIGLHDAHFQWAAFAEAGALSLVCLPGPVFAGSALAFAINPPAWSLFFEYLANFIYAACARHLTTLRLLLVVLAAGAGLVAATWAFKTPHPGGDWPNLIGGLPRVLFGFGVGLLLYRMRLKRTLGHAAAVSLALVLGSLLLWHSYVPTAVRLGIALFALPILLHFSAATKVAGRLARLCSWLGAISYPVYVLHHPILHGLHELIAPLDPGNMYVWQVWIGSAILVIGLSHVLARFVDVPVRQWLSRVTSPRRSAGTAAETP